MSDCTEGKYFSQTLRRCIPCAPCPSYNRVHANPSRCDATCGPCKKGFIEVEKSIESIKHCRRHVAKPTAPTGLVTFALNSTHVLSAPNSTHVPSEGMETWQIVVMSTMVGSLAAMLVLVGILSQCKRRRENKQLGRNDVELHKPGGCLLQPAALQGPDDGFPAQSEPEQQRLLQADSEQASLRGQQQVPYQDRQSVGSDRQDGQPGVADRQDGQPGVADRQDGQPGVADRQDGQPGVADRQDRQPGVADRQDGQPGVADRQPRDIKVVLEMKTAIPVILVNTPSSNGQATCDDAHLPLSVEEDGVTVPNPQQPTGNTDTCVVTQCSEELHVVDETL